MYSYACPKNGAVDFVAWYRVCVFELLPASSETTQTIARADSSSHMFKICGFDPFRVRAIWRFTAQRQSPQRVSSKSDQSWRDIRSRRLSLSIHRGFVDLLLEARFLETSPARSESAPCGRERCNSTPRVHKAADCLGHGQTWTLSSCPEQALHKRTTWVRSSAAANSAAIHWQYIEAVHAIVTDCSCVILSVVNGNWHLPAKSKTIPDPYNGEEFVKVPDPQVQYPQLAPLWWHQCQESLVFDLPTVNNVRRQICVQVNEVSEFVKSLQAVPKTGRHNPLKNPER